MDIVYIGLCILSFIYLSRKLLIKEKISRNLVIRDFDFSISKDYLLVRKEKSLVNLDRYEIEKHLLRN